MTRCKMNTFLDRALINEALLNHYPCPDYFCFLAMITLISQIRFDMSHGYARYNHILAKAHARMGMMIALGKFKNTFRARHAGEHNC